MNTRREFLAASILSAAAAPVLSAQPQPKSSNDKIQIALIGCGSMGQNDVHSSLATGLTKIVAASDCYDGRLQHMRERYGREIFITKDYRGILARPDVDAVIVATPDHWHQQITLDALNAKKDVYCEKPMVQHVEDGAAVVEAEKRTGRILQIGSQGVSSVVYAKARELYQRGAIGELNMVEAWNDRNSAVGAWEYTIPPDASTATCDWTQFQGRAPKTNWDPKRFFRWRCYRDYGTGVAGDLFVHLFSGLHFILESQGPARVYAAGGLRFWKDGRDVPDVLLGVLDYPRATGHPAFNLVMRVNFASGSANESSGFRFIGSEGVMTIGNKVTISSPSKQTEPGYSIGTFSEAEQAAFLKQYRAEYPEQPIMQEDVQQVYSAPRGYSDHVEHHRNFATAVRSRAPVKEDAQFGFRAAAAALLCNVSYFERGTVEWDPVLMQVRS